MKVFVFFVEPSSYTLDLIENIHRRLNIEYIFLNADTHAKHENNVNNYPHLRSKSIIEQLIFIRKIHKKYQLIIFNGYNHWEFFFIFFLNKLTLKKKIIAIDSDTRFRKRSGLKRILKKFYLFSIFSNKYVFGFPGGNHSHKKLFTHYGMKEENIFLMPMMVNNRKFFAPLPRKENPFTFLFVGRMIPLKQIEFLIKSFLKNYDNVEDIHLKIVGGGELYDPLTKKYGHHNNITFTGPKYGQELIHEYHTSNVLVLPSDKEQWGLVINEAMAAGLPVIASDQVGAIYDLIMGKETGFVFSLEKENDLAEKMERFVKDRKLYRTYAKNAQKFMMEEWNYELYKKNLLAAIDRAKIILNREEIS